MDRLDPTQVGPGCVSARLRDSERYPFFTRGALRMLRGSNLPSLIYGKIVTVILNQFPHGLKQTQRTFQTGPRPLFRMPLPMFNLSEPR